MQGGQQIGAPFVKSMLSRLGRSVALLVRRGSAPTTRRARSRPTTGRSCSRSASSPTRASTLAIELVAKARRHRLPVAEIPTIWLERAAGRVELQGVGVAAAPTSAGTSTHSDRRSPRAAQEQHHEHDRRQRLRRLHRRLSRAGASRPRPRGRRDRQPLQVRPGHAHLRRPPQLPARRGRLPRRRPDDRAAHRTATTSSPARR